MLCLRQPAANATNSSCAWALVLNSALQSNLASQIIELQPAGVFVAGEIDVLDTERW